MSKKIPSITLALLIGTLISANTNVFASEDSHTHKIDLVANSTRLLSTPKFSPDDALEFIKLADRIDGPAMVGPRVVSNKVRAVFAPELERLATEFVSGTNFSPNSALAFLALADQIDGPAMMGPRVVSSKVRAVFAPELERLAIRDLTGDVLSPKLASQYIDLADQIDGPVGMGPRAVGKAIRALFDASEGSAE